ncbi:MAG: heterodisulfide reductase-related iron-sulfur binding cluster [Hyphomicrobiaceae bacterium]
MTATTFADVLESRAEGILEACTACGKCFEACPMTEPAGLDTEDPKRVTGAVRDLLAGEDGSPAAQRWASVCTGSGFCIPACPEGVNPRFMLTLARLAKARRQPSDTQRQVAAKNFRKMSKSVRVLSRMQLPADVLARFGDVDKDDEDETADVVFYTGCNLRRTPHIALLCFDIMDQLGINYKVLGGPQMCCGIIQLRTGDMNVAENVSYRTTDRFAAARPKHVLAWCPTCHIQFSETVLPGRKAAEPDRFSFDMKPFVVFLAERLGDLIPHLTRRVEKRVALHEHPGVAGVSESAIKILQAVPGVDLIDTRQPRVGYMCNTLNTLPDFKRQLHLETLQAAKDAGVDTLAGVYHVCHRELCSHERDWPFEVVNFLEIVGASMGLRREDQFKRLKMMQDAGAIVADVAGMAAEHRLPLDLVEDVVLGDLLGEQPLPLAATAPAAAPRG